MIKVNALNVLMDSMLFKVNAQLKLVKENQILTVLNRMKLVNVLNVELSILYKTVPVHQLEKIHSVKLEPVNVDQENV